MLSLKIVVFLYTQTDNNYGNIYIEILYSFLKFPGLNENLSKRNC